MLAPYQINNKPFGNPCIHVADQAAAALLELCPIPGACGSWRVSGLPTLCLATASRTRGLPLTAAGEGIIIQGICRENAFVGLPEMPLECLPELVVPIARESPRIFQRTMPGTTWNNTGTMLGTIWTHTWNHLDLEPRLDPHWNYTPKPGTTHLFYSNRHIPAIRHYPC